MRNKIFTLLLITAAGLASCRKDKNEPNIKQYDEQQIQSYMQVHGLTGFKRDTSGGDTTGIYYKLILPGQIRPGHTALEPLDYPDTASFVYTISSFDGKYIQSDTIANHTEDFLGHLNLSPTNAPAGLVLAIKNIIKYRGASARLLIPSHLAYGTSGSGSGSSSVANTKIAGNQCLDYYIHLIADYKTYDDQVIRSRWDVSSYTKVQSTTYPGNYYYYKILTPGTGASPLTLTSSIVYTDTGSLLNGTIFDDNNADGGRTLAVGGFTGGVSEVLQRFAVAGTKISFILPSAVGYGNTTQGSIPANSCLRFTFQIISSTP